MWKAEAHVTGGGDYLPYMVAKHKISEVIMRIARALDRADEKLAKTCYHDDAIEDHGAAYSGPASGYIEGAMPRIRAAGVMCHYVTNISIWLEGETAYAESYVTSFVRLDRDGTPIDSISGGRWVDRFELREGEWKIAHRKISFDWNRDMPMSETWGKGLDRSHPLVYAPRKDRHDLSYLRF